MSSQSTQDSWVVGGGRFHVSLDATRSMPDDELQNRTMEDVSIASVRPPEVNRPEGLTLFLPFRVRIALSGVQVGRLRRLLGGRTEQEKAAD